MVKNTVAILDCTDFFIDNINLPKDSRKKYITLRNKNCIRYLKKINIRKDEVFTEIIKIDNSIKRYEIEDFIKNNFLKYELILILKHCRDNTDLKELTFLNQKLREKNLRVLNLLYGKNEIYKNIELKGKIIVSLKEKEENLFNEIMNICNSVLNLMKNNKELLFNLCNKENVPMINLNINNLENIGAGILYIIKNFKDIQYLDVLILTLISRKKISIEDIYYIKDPLEEYMDYNKKIILQELLEKNYKDNLTINLIGLK